MPLCLEILSNVKVSIAGKLVWFYVYHGLGNWLAYKAYIGSKSYIGAMCMAGQEMGPE